MAFVNAGLLEIFYCGNILAGMQSLITEVAATPGGEHVLACIQCGSCTGICPVADRMEYPLRKTIAMIRADMRDEVLSSNSMWHCLSCYLCSCRCPRGVKPAELAHALESLATQHDYRIKGTHTPVMYRSFVSSIKGYGRVYEFGMMLRYYLLANPLAALKMLPVGLRLFLHRRLSLMPKKVRGREDLRIITRRFKELRGTH